MSMLGKKYNSQELKAKADYIRSEVIRIALRQGAGHIAPSLSCLDILTALYYGCLSYDPDDPLWEERDRLILSKGHGCYGLYAILADKGILPKREWENFYSRNSRLCGCVRRNLEYGLEADCGSLGHGLPMAVGLGLGALLRKKSYFVFCIVGDGELQEGSNWEALQFALKHEVRNLIIIVDRNRLQALDFIAHTLDRGSRDIIKRFQGFGFSPVICPGHNISELNKCLRKAQASPVKKPKVIIAETVKGYGLRCMENIPKFHYRLPACGGLLGR